MKYIMKTGPKERKGFTIDGSSEKLDFPALNDSAERPFFRYSTIENTPLDPKYTGPEHYQELTLSSSCPGETGAIFKGPVYRAGGWKLSFGLKHFPTTGTLKNTEKINKKCIKRM